mgnify:CR=1 FL=1
MDAEPGSAVRPNVLRFSREGAAPPSHGASKPQPGAAPSAAANACYAALAVLIRTDQDTGLRTQR